MGNPIVHFEIGCKDKNKTSEFYSKLFDWKLTDIGIASSIDTGGISGQIVALGHEPNNYTMFYVEVDDVQKYLDHAVHAGGKKLVGPITIPTGTFAWFSDPEGNMVGLWKSKS